MSCFGHVQISNSQAGRVVLAADASTASGLGLGTWVRFGDGQLDYNREKVKLSVEEKCH